MRLEIKIIGEADNPRAVAQAAVTAAAGAGLEGGRANVSFGNVQSSDPIFPEVSAPVVEEVAVEQGKLLRRVEHAAERRAVLAGPPHRVLRFYSF